MKWNLLYLEIHFISNLYKKYTYPNGNFNFSPFSAKPDLDHIGGTQHRGRIQIWQWAVLWQIIGPFHHLPTLYSSPRWTGWTMENFHINIISTEAGDKVFELGFFFSRGFATYCLFFWKPSKLPPRGIKKHLAK